MSEWVKAGAHEWNRTIDLFLTKEVLYRLSYVSVKLWSGRRESNPRNQFGKLMFYH